MSVYLRLKHGFDGVAKAADQLSWVCLSFTKPLEDSRDVGKSLSYRQSTEMVDAAKLSPAALTAGNAEEEEVEGGKGEYSGGGVKGEKSKIKLEGGMKRSKVCGEGEGDDLRIRQGRRVWEASRGRGAEKGRRGCWCDLFVFPKRKIMANR